MANQYYLSGIHFPSNLSMMATGLCIAKEKSPQPIRVSCQETTQWMSRYSRSVYQARDGIMPSTGSDSTTRIPSSGYRMLVPIGRSVTLPATCSSHKIQA